MVRKIVGGEKVSENVENLAESEKVEDDIEKGKLDAEGNETQADVAAEVADSAQKLDEEPQA